MVLGTMLIFPSWQTCSSSFHVFSMRCKKGASEAMLPQTTGLAWFDPNLMSAIRVLGNAIELLRHCLVWLSADDFRR